MLKTFFLTILLLVICQFKSSGITGFTNITDTLTDADTIKVKNNYPDSLKTDTVDTTGIRKDSMKKKESNKLEYPVYYYATDSNTNFVSKKIFYLYGEAEIKYDDIQLNADFIRLDLDKNELLAYGLPDSTGEISGKPVFKQGDETFKADSIRYNFKTKKGIINEVTSEFDGSFMHGSRTKRHADKTVHIVNGKFTTCNLDHPHFYFKLSKAKIIPDNKIVSGPAYMVLEDIPTPLGIPFGFFPNQKGASSGVIIPEYGEEANRGFFLKNGGYYWAINDYLDLMLTGSIFSKGSWAVRANTNYKVRYKMNGKLSFHYNENVLGYKGIEGYSNNKLYKFRWQHRQDPKAHPNMNFNASVNISSSAYDQFNTYNPRNYMRNTKQSSVNFSKHWPGTPFSLNMSLLHSQNSSDSSMTLTLPQLSFNMSRIYPLKRKESSGKKRFYEKIGVSYSMATSNRVKAHEDSIFKSDFDDFTNGIKHSVPVNTSFKVLKHLTLSPNFNYQERWYFNETKKYWDDSLFNSSDSSFGGVREIEKQNFVRAWDYRVGANLSTKLYGMFEFKSERLKAIRHVLTPSISYSYFPDFSDNKYGFYEDYISDIRYNSFTGQYDTVRSTYSRFEGGIYGSPPSGGAGSVNFSLNNKLDMKLDNPDDTASKVKKVAILESFNLRTNYNIMADSLNWSPLSVAGRTRIGKFNINFNATFDPYTYMVDSNGAAFKINEFEYNNSGKPFRLTRAGISMGVSFRAGDDNNKNTQRADYLYGYPHSYVDFSVPWSLNFDYALNYSKPYNEKTVTQTLNFSGDVNLTKKWKISFNSGYDFENKDLTYTLVEIHRDLHCWQMSLSFVPVGSHKYYSFKLNVKSGLLQDLKLQKRQTWWDNI